MVMLPGAVVLLAALLLGACSSGGGGGSGEPASPPLAQTYRPTGKAAAGATLVHLFEWRWTDVARECEVFLGPMGFDGVQISPPSEHAVITNAASGVSFPWWQRYQTVSYLLDQSRSGTLAEFRDMVARCNAVGVGIYADAVINHMTAGSGTGSAGSSYTKYNYPAVPYTSTDFHTPCSIDSYQDAFQVQNCELVGLADLKTEDDSVRTKIANYLIALHSLGVAGFRIDAAKHIAPVDLDAILAKLNAAAQAASPPRSLPYVFLEVIGNAGEAVTPQQYYGVGYASGGASDITEFNYGYRVSDAFLGRNATNLDALQNLDAGLLPSDKAVVFTDNHDNQRADNIYYASTLAAQPIYELAVIYTLAQPLGTVSLMSSFGFDRSTQAGQDAGPPGSGGVTASTFSDIGAGVSACTIQLASAQVGSWICEHRRPAIAQMVRFRRAVAGAPLSNWTLVNGNPNQVAFARTGLGFVALNRDTVAGVPQVLRTTLPDGSYCNVAADVFTPPNSCSGVPIAVSGGAATITLPARGAVALYVGAKL
ncbi:MAG TPA: alpha-amylase family protein [Burkholderiaceae bacterium]|nr:alpha-amylase family protein [Burkholderiaceae bacterium]